MALLGLDFDQSKSDHSLFVYKKDELVIVVLTYVDDVIIVGNNSHKIQEIEKCLNEKFSIKYPGLLKYFFGIEVARISNGLVLSQRKFDILKDSDMEG